MRYEVDSVSVPVLTTKNKYYARRFDVETTPRNNYGQVEED